MPLVPFYKEINAATRDCRAAGFSEFLNNPWYLMGESYAVRC